MFKKYNIIYFLFFLFLGSITIGCSSTSSTTTLPSNTSTTTQNQSVQKPLQVQQQPATQLPPLRNAKEYYHRAHASFQKNQYELAIADFSKVLELGLNKEDESLLSEVYERRAESYGYTGKPDLALADLEKVEKRTTHRSTLREVARIRGDINLARGNYEAALKDSELFIRNMGDYTNMSGHYNVYDYPVTQTNMDSPYTTYMNFVYGYSLTKLKKDDDKAIKVLKHYISQMKDKPTNPYVIKAKQQLKEMGAFVE